MRFDDRLVGRAGLLQAERDSITRLLAVLEAARGVDRWKRTTTVGPYGDPLGLFRVENELVLALAACDADPLLAPKANTGPTQ